MPRTRRIIPREAALHIMSRGNNKQCIFRCNRDKYYYKSLLKELKEENNISIFHYCIMDNHTHLIVWLDGTGNLSRFMKQLNLSYFNYYKKTYGCCGHIWQGRYKSSIIDTDSYLLQCGKYIELNPVRAGIVKYPNEYSFSSYCHYAFGLADSIVSDNPVYLGFSESSKLREKRYVEFVVDSEIMNSGYISSQIFIGSDLFVKKLAEVYQIKNLARKKGRPRRTA
ncbi:MAG: transposase [Candidatus Omnitrophica bacterium]|nr:transposase [Candidatus Omnitrophota bacterium]